MPRQDDRQWLAYAMLAVVMLLWAGNSIVGRAVADQVPAFTLALIRWGGASLFLLPFAWKSLQADLPVIRRHWKILLALGMLGIGLFNALLYLALHYTTASNSLLLQAAIPPMVLLFDRLIFAARPTRPQLVGVTLSSLGVVVVITTGSLAALLALQFGVGDVLMLIAVTIWGLYTSLLRLRPPIDPRSFLAVTFAVGVITLLPAAATEWSSMDTSDWDGGIYAAFLYVALLPSLIAYGLFNRAVTMIGAGKAGQTSSLLPLFGAFLAAGILNEPLGRHHFIGMALILAGILVVALFRPGGATTAGRTTGPR